MLPLFKCSPIFIKISSYFKAFGQQEIHSEDLYTFGGKAEN